MNPASLPTIEREFCDSILCFHAIENVGFGLYGDPTNPRSDQLCANL